MQKPLRRLHLLDQSLRCVRYFRPGGVPQDISLGLIDNIVSFAVQVGQRLDKMEEILTENRIWQERLVDIGIVTAQEAMDWGFSGVICSSNNSPPTV